MTELLGLLKYGTTGWGDELLAGLAVTLGLFLATLPFGLLLGFLLALAKRRPRGVVRGLAVAFTDVFRSVPELLTIFIVFFGLQIGLQKFVELFSETATIELNDFVAGMIALGIVFAAYSSETFLAALNAVPSGQGEAARALGLGRVRTMQKVVFPQVLRHALPGLSNLTLILQKETALVSVIALDELLRQSQVAAGGTKQYLFFFGVACVGYLILAFLTGQVLDRIERMTRRGEARA